MFLVYFISDPILPGPSLLVHHRNRMEIETENNQLFINYNMSDLENWNPISAVLYWLGLFSYLVYLFN